jgi:hypothetical protein
VNNVVLVAARFDPGSNVSDVRDGASEKIPGESDLTDAGMQSDVNARHPANT